MSKIPKPMGMMPDVPFKHTIRNRLGQSLFRVNDDLHKDLSGKILTIIDATIGDPEQRKAVKDLVKISLSQVADKLSKAARDISDSVACHVGDDEMRVGTLCMGVNDYAAYVEPPDYKYSRSE